MNRPFCILLACAFAASVPGAAAGASAPNYPNNRAPLAPKAYVELPLGAVRAKGWLGEMLERQRSGATGRMDELYPEVMGPRNGWLGGDGDQWERGPYWIDGLLPLAWLLDDAELKAKVRPWIEWILQSQREDGYFGPATDYPGEFGLQRNNSADWWPRMVVLKILQQYYSATNDRRVIDFMTRYFRYQLKTLPDKPLGHWSHWAVYRACDNLQAVYWLYNLTGDGFLLELGDLLHRQGHDYTGMFLESDDLKRFNSIHCVNLAQGFKEPVIYYQRRPERRYLDAVKKGFSDLALLHGQPQGMYGADEGLHGGDPTQGSELCAAVEMMFSLEQILQITGGREWGDYLERVAYNALPTQTTDAQDARQYYQQVNQVEVTRKVRPFSTPHEDTDIVFGLYTGYPSCTSNLHQGWPKLVQNLWYATRDGGLAALVYALRMNEKWERHAMEPEKQTLYGPYYYEVTSDSPWNYCLPKANVRPEKVAESFVVEDAGEMAPYPWTPDGSPVKIRTQAHRIGDWTLHGGSAGPIAFVSSQQMYMTPEAEWIELIPYGCTTLRVTEFPVR